MVWLVVVGVALAVAGLGLIAASAARVVRARRAGLDDEALRARLRAALPLNLGGMAVSGLGLMAVVTGVLLD